MSIPLYPTHAKQRIPRCPGTLVAIVGPSGAGKDTILNGARAALAQNPDFVFARRCITRAPDATENNLAVTDDTFLEMVERGQFLLWWCANGLKYGVPIGLIHDLSLGKIVIINASRTVVSEIQARFEHHLVVEITADPALLRARLMARGRETSARQDARLHRNDDQIITYQPDVAIANNSTPAHAISILVDTLSHMLLHHCVES